MLLSFALKCNAWLDSCRK